MHTTWICVSSPIPAHQIGHHKRKSGGQSMLVSGTSTSNSTLPARITSLTVENIPIQIADQGTGVPTLLLHGIFDSADTWRGVTERLQANYRCLAPDLPGFGRS